MNVLDSFDVRIVGPDGAKSREELLHRLAAVGASLEPVAALGLKADDVERLVLERERGGSTDLGVGIVFPHARIHGLTRLSVVMCTQRPPLPVCAACLMLIPEDAPMLALKFMSRVADCVRTGAGAETLCRLLDAGDRSGLGRLLALDDKKTLTAHDLMRP